MGIEEEFEQHNNQKSWNLFFDQLQNASFGKHESSARDARRPKFRSRNRYADVSPYDHSRVRLVRNNIDYINASLVMVPEAERSYILTQGPLKETAGHFWLMLWEQNSRAVIMLNRIIEKEQVKCYQYYPVGQDNEGDDEMVFNDVGLKVTFLAERHCNYHFTTRVLQLTDLVSDETREVLQFHYTAWPDFGVPESPTAFLDFLFTVREHGVLNNEDAPPVIHCSAGIGRSGTICMVDSCLVLASRNGGNLNGVNVVNVLIEMRHYRMGLIQTADQLRFSYLAIIEGAKRLFQDNAGVQTANKCDDSSDGLLDELDAINSFDSIIDSLDELNDNEVSRTPSGSSAQASLEGLFVKPDVNVINTTEDVRSEKVPEDNGSTLDNSSQSRLECDETKNLNNGTKSLEESPESSSRNEEAAKKDFLQRSRDERVKKTAEQIARIKQRMNETERQRDRQQRFQPYVVAGFSVLAGVCAYLAYLYLN